VAMDSPLRYMCPYIRHVENTDLNNREKSGDSNFIKAQMDCLIIPLGFPDNDGVAQTGSG